MTKTPEEIAASLGKRERTALSRLGVLPSKKAKVSASVRHLAAKGLASWWIMGFVITPLGRAVAAAIRDSKRGHT